MLAWELVGTVIGAGLASGREVAAFFARFGYAGYAGAFLAVAVMIWLADAEMPEAWQNRLPESVWKMAQCALLIATGGAMLSGAGEIAAISIPMHFAYGIGVVCTLCAAWLLARKTVNGLACVSKILLVVLGMMIGLGILAPKGEVVVLTDTQPVQGLLKGVTYGGFNAALQAPVLAKAGYRKHHGGKYGVYLAGIIIFCLLIMGIIVLHRHREFMSEPMPFLRMLAHYGKVGFCLGAISLYLAILSTLTACLRGLNGTFIPIAGILTVSLLGFSGVVNWAYPVLGGSCFVMMLAAKFRKYVAKI